MELVAGPTLADCIAEGPIPLDEALPIAKQIAEALEAAARAGHHSPRSQAREHPKCARTAPSKCSTSVWRKLIDRPSLNAAPATKLPHDYITSDHDGRECDPSCTAAYMAPEQARGGAADKGADIWAFGGGAVGDAHGRPTVRVVRNRVRHHRRRC
jgi:serine/threonine-protein kinase